MTASAIRAQLDLFDGRRKRGNPRQRTPEHLEQAAVMDWARMHEKRWPALELLHAVPNGGFRFKATAAAMKREGVKSGVPDLDLPVSRGKWHGLRIEMKAHDGRPSESQRWWIDRLQAEGYRAEVCYGWEAARDVLIEYLTTE